MTPRDFCYWLRGFIELNGTPTDWQELDCKQWKMIREHLDMVFNQSVSDEDGYKKVTPKVDYNRRLCASDLPQSTLDHLIRFNNFASC